MAPTDAEIGSRLCACTRFGRLVHVPSCTSTQELAAADTAPLEPWTVYWADHQTAGRGRRQRTWDDEPGADLTATFRVRAVLPEPVALPAAVALCVLQAVEQAALPALSRTLRLKWPNDVLLDGRKLAGVLIDAGVAGPGSLAVGVGINVNRTRLPRELEGRATSLALADGREHDRADLLLDLARRLDAVLGLLAAAEPARVAALEAAFRERLGLMGRIVECEAGRRTTGLLTGLDFREIAFADGRRVPLGQVQMLRAAPAP